MDVGNLLLLSGPVLNAYVGFSAPPSVVTASLQDNGSSSSGGVSNLTLGNAKSGADAAATCETPACVAGVVSGVDKFPSTKDRWMSNEEIAGILLSSESHPEWQSEEVSMRPKSGSVILYSRSRSKYRRDGYYWKKRRDGKTTREDHMKLKVNGVEFIYGCYVHSAVLPTFHRRCYWLLQNPDLVLVHYLNVPATTTSGGGVGGGDDVHHHHHHASQHQQLQLQQQHQHLQQQLSSLQDGIGALWTKLVGPRSPAAKDSGRAALTQEEILVQLKSMLCGEDGVDGVVSFPGPSSFVDVDGCGGGGNVSADANDGVEASVEELVVSGVIGSAGAGVRPMISSRSSNSLLTPASSPSGERRRSETSVSAKPNKERLLLPALAPGVPQHVTTLKQQASFFILKNITPTTAAAVTSNAAVVPAVPSIVGTSAGAAGPGDNCAEIDTNSAMVAAVDEIVPDIGVGSATVTATVAVNTAAPAGASRQGADVIDGPPSASVFHHFDLEDLGGPESSLFGVDLWSASQEDEDPAQSDDVLLNFDDVLGSADYAMPSPVSVAVIPNPVAAAATGVAHGHQQQLLHHRQLPPQSWANPGEEAPTVTVTATATTAVNAVGLGNAAVVASDRFEVEHGRGVGDDDDNNGGSRLSSTFSSDYVPSHRGATSAGGGGTMDYREGTATITDFSPESASSLGGTKILVTGPWYSATCPYSIMFGDLSVPAALVQSGVLRCFTPGRAPGKVQMKVACEGFVISNGVEFVFTAGDGSSSSPPAASGVSCNPGPGSSALSLSRCGSSLGVAGRQLGCCAENADEEGETALILQLFEKLDGLERKLEPADNGEDASGDNASSERCSVMEEALVNVCKSLMNRPWTGGANEANVGSLGGGGGQRKSLLHIVASLGYTRLACALLHWTAERPSRILNAEVDALGCDASGSTPLMSACRRGQRDAALLLYQWNRAALHLRRPADGASAVDVAARAGHADIADEIQRLERRREASLGAGGGCRFVAGAGGGAGSCSSVNSASSSASSSSSASRCRDGEFRRPADPRTFASRSSCDDNGFRQRQLSLDSPSPIPGGSSGHRHSCQQWLAKRPSVDSGVCMPCGGGTSSIGNNMNAGNACEGGHASCHPGSSSATATTSSSTSTSGWARASPRLTQPSRCSCSCGGNNSGQFLASFDHGNLLHPQHPPQQQQQLSHSTPSLRRGNSLSLPSTSSASANNGHFGAGCCMSDANKDLGLSFESDVLSCVSNQSQRSARGESLSACGSSGGGGVFGSGCPDTVSPFSSFMDSESFADLEVGSDEEPDAKLCAMDLSSFDSVSDKPYQQRSMPQQHRGSFSHCDLSAGEGMSGEQEEKVFLLAEQIIAALPERIKLDSALSTRCDADNRLDPGGSHTRCCGARTPLSWTSSPPSACVCSPNKSRSWACTCHSAAAYSSATMADFSEFFQASTSFLGCERDFSKLTLSDQEQRELYEAACVIQKAYRSYKGRVKQKEEQEKELSAAIVIQNYYRRYKQYAYHKQMTRAAKVIQTKFRNYCKWKHCYGGDEAGMRAEAGIPNVEGTSSIQPSSGQSSNEADLFMFGSRGLFHCASREGTPTSLKRTISQRRQHQAAKKIQQFMRQSKNKLQRERALQAAGPGSMLPPTSAMLDQASQQQRCCHQQQQQQQQQQRRQQLVAASRVLLQRTAQQQQQQSCL